MCQLSVAYRRGIPRDELTLPEATTSPIVWLCFLGLTSVSPPSVNENENTT